jgi:hypothetical protein
MSYRIRPPESWLVRFFNSRTFEVSTRVSLPKEIDTRELPYLRIIEIIDSRDAWLEFDNEEQAMMFKLEHFDRS